MKRFILVLLIAAFNMVSYAQIETTEGDMQQDHFDFLRTDEGYKVISVTLSP